MEEKDQEENKEKGKEEDKEEKEQVEESPFANVKIDDMTTEQIVKYLSRIRGNDFDNIIIVNTKKGLLTTLYYRTK